MKVTKKQLQRLIREERAKLLNESRGVFGIGFGNFGTNDRPNFAKAYGREARVVGLEYQRPNMSEQPMPAPTSDPVESAYQELKYSGAYKDLQTSLHDSLVDLEGLFEKHSDMMLQADQGSLLDDLQEVMANLDNLRQTFNALR